MSNEPITGQPYQEAGSKQTDAVQNSTLNYFGAWVNCAVLNVGQAAPTGSEADGDRYIVGIGTGVFAGHDDELAILRGGTWQFHAPPAAGVPIIKNLADNSDWECVAGVWAEKAGGGGSTELADLDDVDVTGVADGDTLVWDAATSKWIPGTGGGGGGMVLLGSVVAGVGGSASLSVSGISGGYGALKIVYNGRGAKVATFDGLRINFNGDTGANYNNQLSSFTGGSAYFSSTVNSTFGDIGFVPAASATANEAASLEMIIPNYAGTVFNKSSIATYALDTGTTSGGMRNVFWHPATPAAITSVTLTLAGGNHVAGSTLNVYGMPV